MTGACSVLKCSVREMFARLQTCNMDVVNEAIRFIGVVKFFLKRKINLNSVKEVEIILLLEKERVRNHLLIYQVER